MFSAEKSSRTDGQTRSNNNALEASDPTGVNNECGYLWDNFNFECSWDEEWDTEVIPHPSETKSRDLNHSSQGQKLSRSMHMLKRQMSVPFRALRKFFTRRKRQNESMKIAIWDILDIAVSPIQLDNLEDDYG